MVAQDWMPPAGAQPSKLEPSDTGISNTIKINSRAAATTASRTASSTTRGERDTEHLQHAVRREDTSRRHDAETRLGDTARRHGAETRRGDTERESKTRSESPRHSARVRDTQRESETRSESRRHAARARDTQRESEARSRKELAGD